MARVVALMDDLLFLSRIQAAARGVSVKAVTRLPPLLALKPEVVLLDLDSWRVDALEALRGIRSDPEFVTVPVFGFISHVQVGRAQEAQAAGCTRVLARSAFLAELPSLLAPSGSTSVGHDLPG